MTRPMYESPQDLRNEADIISALEPRMRCVFKKMPIKYGLDYVALRDGTALGFVEIKCRTNPMGKYDTYMISLHKMMTARSLMETTNLPANLIVRWSDGLVGKVSFGTDITVGFNGRYDRNDSEDVEPVALIPISSFELIPL